MDPQKEKEEYFRLLYSLSEVSEDEDEAVEQRESLRKALQSKPPFSSTSSIPSLLEHPSETRRQQQQPRKKLPVFRHATSEPDSSVVKETPALPRTKSLLRYSDTSTQFLDEKSFVDNSAVEETPVQPQQPRKKLPGILRTISVPESSFIKETPPIPCKTSLLHYSDASTPVVAKPSFLNTSVIEETPIERPQERSLSTPNIGSVVMKNSSGIASMLNNKNNKKKRKRKETKIKLVSENERIFDGQTFFFIPNDEIAPPRRDRILAARNYGAVWAEEWIPSITHVVVDKDLNYTHAMEFLKPLMKADTLPPHIILVNEEYPVHCIRFRARLDANQKIYSVRRENMETEEPEIPRQNSVEFDRSPKLNAARPRKGDDNPEQHTLPRSPIDSQHCLHNTESPAIWLPGEVSRQQKVMASPQEDLSPAKAQGFVRHGDELDKMIELALQVKHLPLDADDDDEDKSVPSGDVSEDTGTSDEGCSAARKAKKQRRPVRNGTNQATYACMQSSAVSLDSNPNKKTIEILLEMAEHYAKIREEWKPQAYRKAVQTLKRETRKISTYEEAIVLPNVGHRLATKIEEIVRTDRLQRLENAKSNPTDQVLSAFMKIYGVGHDQASKWIQAGFRTIDDLKARAKLSMNQRLGIEHYVDFNTKIPRDQVTALGEIVKKAVATIDPDVNVMIMGSYRRGASQSGDIDLLLTKTGTTSSDDLMPMLNQLTDTLTRDSFLVAALAKPHQGKSKSGPGPKSGSKWHGACMLPGNPIWRRIDFLLVPESELGAALIYFTGDDIFNRSIRLLSSHKGMRLNQRGLYKDVMRGPGRVKLNEGTLVEGADERKIFRVLGVPWRPPEQRVIH